MAWLTRDEVKDIVCDSLNEIGNFNGDCEEILIAEIEDVYKLDFCDAIQNRMDERGFEVDLSLNDDTSGINNMNKISSLIDYVRVNQMRAI
ncbi:MAG: hypothetical protein ED557_08560 [Balneola sp.]|nr:MAG: hypothetical protein ED557_08560 [Balneola sp.]